ncbi:L-Aspartase-like protein [Aspergillus venezuelensis]
MGEASFCNEHQAFGLNLSEYTKNVLSSFREVTNAVEQQNPINLDGYSLRLSDTFALSKHNVPVTVTTDPNALSRMEETMSLLDKELASGKVVYGVNSGFGGNADTRTNAHEDLQKALIQHQNTAVVLPSDKGHEASSIIRNLRSHSIPIPIVRVAMAARANSLIRGHSAVRVQIVRNLATMLNEEFTPVVPLRGSISASGDLTPLAYIAGALEGNSDIWMHTGHKGGRGGEIVPADKALSMLNIEPLTLRPKEGLGLINGTAFSTGAASLVLYEANQLVLLTQVLTGMTAEALLGTGRSFDPFIADVRPHPGQREVAANIHRFLSDSKLTLDHKHSASINELAQDRYPLRTASQWIGPHVENMALALAQVSIELNSTTDNPLFDAAKGEIHHGGNFQASIITNAMEKTSSAMQSLGKLIFTQHSELLNPMLSKGLPPNLCADDPSLSYALKGVDINMASYMSELGYLNTPISNFVQTADVNNQPVNSLALIGARYAADAVEVFSLMVASHIYALCQAVDLREMHRTFESKAKKEMIKATSHILGTVPETDVESVWAEIMNHWNKHPSLDHDARAKTSVTNALGTLFTLLTKAAADSGTVIIDANKVSTWQNSLTEILTRSCADTRKAYMASPPQGSLLCSSSAKIYTFVRQTLKVPMHKGLVDHPTYKGPGSDNGTEKKTIGTHIGTIYAALREGRFMGVLGEIFA